MTDITIVGGITADIEGHPYGQLIMGDSNPGKISISYGGVGRNMTENLARLGARVALISVAGDDFTGKGVVTQLQELGVNVDGIRLLKDENTAMYLSILNIFGEMELALSNMDVLERISEDMIRNFLPMLKASKIVGVDTNLKEEALRYLLDNLERVPLFLDPVSVTKAQRVKTLIGRFHTVKPNRLEAEAITGMSILREGDLFEAGKWFEDKGVKRTFITLSGGGVYYKEGNEEGIIRPAEGSVVSATGAGDAFSAAVMDGYVKGMSAGEAARYGMSVASIAMEAKTAVNPEMSLIEAVRRMKNVE